MAKKPLKAPAVPVGERKTFFEELQRMVIDSGDLATTELGKQLGCSHQAVYKALTGPKMPSERMVRALAEKLGGDAEATLQLWRRGVAEQRAAANAPVGGDRSSGVDEDLRAGMSDLGTTDAGYEEPVLFGTDTSVLAPPFEESDRSWAFSRPEPDLSPREIEVLLHWARSESKNQVARELYVSVGTLNTHLTRIRDKYAAVGRPASTKAGLVARALQDGLLDLDDL